MSSQQKFLVRTLSLGLWLSYIIHLYSFSLILKSLLSFDTCNGFKTSVLDEMVLDQIYNACIIHHLNRDLKIPENRQIVILQIHSMHLMQDVFLLKDLLIRDIIITCFNEQSFLLGSQHYCQILLGLNTNHPRE